MFGGSVSAATQTYNHPTAAGNALSGQTVGFVALGFRVSTTGSYTLSNNSNTFAGGDGFFALYDTSFSPGSPLTNLIAASDNVNGLRPQITTSLTAGTKYWLLSSAANAGATGDMISQISGGGTYTINNALLPAVDTPTTTNVTGSSAILGGTVEGDGGSAVTERGIVYSVNSVNSVPTIGGNGVTKFTGGSGLGIFTVNVGGLTLGTTYAYRAYATSAMGTFYTSPVQTFVADAPPVLGGIITAQQNVMDNGTIQPFVPVTVTDPDSPPQNETVTLSYTAANGTFTSLGGFTGSAGNYTMTGSAAQVQTALRGLTFVPTAHQTTPGKSITTSFTVSVNDGYYSATDSQTTVVATAASTTSGPTVLPIQVGDGDPQRSEVESMTVTFSGPVTFAGNGTVNDNAAAAFQLTHLTNNQNVTLTATVGTNQSGQTTVMLQFSGSETDPVSGLNGASPSLADGTYQLTILSSKVTGLGGGALNGGGPNGNYVSQADTLGGSGPHLYRLFGDCDGNGVVDSVDVDRLRYSFNSNPSNPQYLWYLDADGGGAVDAVAVNQFRMRFNRNVFG
jgi:hypothetical protein